MKCTNCGAELDKDSVFCVECGTKCEVESSEAQVEEGSFAAAQPNKATGSLKNKIMTMNKKVLAGIGAGIVAVIVLIVVLIANANTINLNKYVEVTYSGYEGYGQATATFDKEKFEKDYGEKLNEKIKQASDGAAILNMFASGSDIFLEFCVDGNLDKTNNLSNGDKITYSWECDEAKAKNFGFKLKFKDKTYTVSDLKEIDTFDIFEGIEVKFENASPLLEASVDTSKSTLKGIEYIDFSLDKTQNIANGDTIIVTASAYGDIAEYCIEQFGKVPKSATKEIKVSGQPTFVTAPSEISENTMSAMKAQGIDTVKADAAKKFDEYQTLASVEFDRSYVLNAKDKDNCTQNYTVLVYKVTVKHNYTYPRYSAKKGTFTNTTSYYWPLIYSNVKNDSEGNSIVDLTDTESFTRNYVNVKTESFKSWSYVGFESVEQLYEKIITSKSDSYSCVADK